MRVTITLPSGTIVAMDRRVAEYKRSQFMHYAAMSMLERLRGTEDALVEADVYEKAAKALVKG